MSRKAKIDPEAWFVCVETASVTLNPGDPTAWGTVREGERRGDDPLLEQAAQLFLPESMTPEQRGRVWRSAGSSRERAIRAEEHRREDESRRLAAEQREQEAEEARKRGVVHVRPPYPEQSNPLTPGAVPPTVQLAAAVAEALDKGDGA